MTNDVSGVNIEEAVPCIALSKNDSYVMSACGGKISLFNMMTFKVIFVILGFKTSSLFASWIFYAFYFLQVTYNHKKVVIDAVRCYSSQILRFEALLVTFGSDL